MKWYPQIDPQFDLHVQYGVEIMSTVFILYSPLSPQADTFTSKFLKYPSIPMEVVFIKNACIYTSNILRYSSIGLFLYSTGLKMCPKAFILVLHILPRFRQCPFNWANGSLFLLPTPVYALPITQMLFSWTYYLQYWCEAASWTLFTWTFLVQCWTGDASKV